MDKFWTITGASLLAVAVMIGAFGAHALQKTLEATGKADVFETGSKYHFYHGIAILVIALAFDKGAGSYWGAANWSFLIGILIFSGSLYTLSVTGISKLGMITPLGGLAFIVGWILVVLGALKN